MHAVPGAGAGSMILPDKSGGAPAAADYQVSDRSRRPAEPSWLATGRRELEAGGRGRRHSESVAG